MGPPIGGEQKKSPGPKRAMSSSSLTGLGGGTESDVELDEVVPLGGEAAKAGLSFRHR